MTTGNGNAAETAVELPAVREAIIDQAHRMHQEVAHERDVLRREVAQLKADAAGYKIAIEAQQAQLANADSRVETANMQRDQAIADRAVYEVLFISFKSQLRAFAIPNAPLVKDKTSTEAQQAHLREQAAIIERQRRLAGEDEL